MKRIVSFALSFVLAIGLIGCAAGGGSTPANSGDRSGGAKKQYTIMVYVDGANLESESGLASQDLQEMIAATYPRDQVNVIVQTGGAKKWSMGEIPSDRIGRYRIGDNGLEELEKLPQQDMVKPETLTDFIDFCYKNYPAERYGLVMWDHGAGPIYGYGVDENFDENNSLYMTDMVSALAASEISKQPLEFIGFDSCLMATLEIAHLLSPYASYMIASQDNEPGEGWDYRVWLSALGRDPKMSGETIGKAVADSFIEFYEAQGTDDSVLALSVIDLKKTQDVVTALEAFVSAADVTRLSFQETARDRSNTKEFGYSSTGQHMLDLIDLADMAKQFSSSNSAESSALTRAIGSAVLYNKKGRNNEISNGLSIYFPYFDRQYLKESMEVYKSMGFSPTYVAFLEKFITSLTGSTITPMDNLTQTMPTQQYTTGSSGSASYRVNVPQAQIGDVREAYFGVWKKNADNTYSLVYRDAFAQIDTATGEIRSDFDGRFFIVNGDPVCLYESDRGTDYVRYEAPAVLNGQEVDLQILLNAENPDGKILGAVPVYDLAHKSNRQLLPIKAGDSLALSYDTQNFDGTSGVTPAGTEATWAGGESRTVAGDLTIQKANVAAGEYLYGFVVIDLQGNNYMTDHIAVNF